MGPIIGLRLTKQECEALEIEQTEVTYWVDSCNVGYGIHSQSRNFKPFIAHPVGAIHEDSNPEQWRYVPGKLNPADHGTRRLTVEELVENECWWGEPTFLNQPQKNWAEGGFTRATAESFEGVQAAVREQEERPQQDNLSSFVTSNQNENQWRLNPVRFSKWYRTKPAGKLEIGISLVRLRSWVSRFIDNCRKSIEQRATGEITREELKRTEEKVISEAQNDAFSEDIKALASGKKLPRKSSILPSTPMVIDDLLRSDTRLRYSNDLPDETKYPIIIPKKHPVTELVVKYHHETEVHEHMLELHTDHIREKYLVVHGRETVKKVIKECFECQRRFRGKPAAQQIAPLPAIRLEATMKPFTNCAVDFARPYLTAQGRGKVRVKRYLWLFLCLQTHCHVDMAWSFDTDGFLNALTPMVARRGWPRDMVSDNGINFIGGCKEINQLVKEIDRDKVQKMTSNKNPLALEPSGSSTFGRSV
ncbi:uncharacterized protein [Acropora muricata]|uniref:uncharacterized protein n=1 Tax=Acropora muricata TaxID=159855 RepID=UPI0034E40542